MSQNNNVIHSQEQSVFGPFCI